MDITCKGHKPASSSFMFSVLPGTWCFACIALRSVTICNFWDSKPRSISEIVCSAMTSAKRSTNRCDGFFWRGLAYVFILDSTLESTKNKPNPQLPNQPNHRRKRTQKVFGDPCCKAKRLGAWQKEQILLEPWWHPATTTAAIAGVFCSREEDCLLQTCYWNVRLDIWRFELWYCRCLKTFFFFEFDATCHVVFVVSLDLSK